MYYMRVQIAAERDNFEETWGLYYGIWGGHQKNPAYRILQTEYSGCLDISAHV